MQQFGVSAEFGYNRLDLSNSVLTSVGVPGGDAHIYSVTREPTVHFSSKGRYGAYVIGGGGFYRRTIDFTAPAVETVTLFDPFFGIFFPAAVPATQVLASFTQNKGGRHVRLPLVIMWGGFQPAEGFSPTLFSALSGT